MSKWRVPISDRVSPERPCSRIQMDLDSRKSEARSDLKRIDIQVEVSIVDIRISYPIC